jgi:hypothetical protein
MAGGGVTPDTCLALGRRCWVLDMEDRPERPEIETHRTLSSKGLSWPVSSKDKADLVIFDPPYFDKKADEYTMTAKLELIGIARQKNGISPLWMLLLF